MFGALRLMIAVFWTLLVSANTVFAVGVDRNCPVNQLANTDCLMVASRVNAFPAPQLQDACDSNNGFDEYIVVKLPKDRSLTVRSTDGRLPIECEQNRDELQNDFKRQQIGLMYFGQNGMAIIKPLDPDYRLKMVDNRDALVKANFSNKTEYLYPVTKSV